jgi:hypothetical protein
MRLPWVRSVILEDVADRSRDALERTARVVWRTVLQLGIPPDDARDHHDSHRMLGGGDSRLQGR